MAVVDNAAMGVSLQLALDSLATAGIYALFGLGIYAAHAGSGVLHLAAGDAAMTGAVPAAALVAGGTPIAAGIAVALLLGAAVSAVLERGLVRPAGGRVALAAATLVAAGAVLRQALTAAYPRAAYPFPAPETTWRIGDGVLRASDVVTVAVAAAVAGAGWALLTRTRAGAALRVTAGGADAAELIGVDTSRVRLGAFAVAGMLAALAALLAAARVAPAPGAGVPLALKGLAGAAAGGLGSPPAVCAGALLIGATEVVAGYELGGMGEVLAYGVAAAAIAARWRWR